MFVDLVITMDDVKDFSDSENSIDEQDLEFALYSQIHFDPPTEPLDNVKRESAGIYQSNFFCLGLEEIESGNSGKAKSEPQWQCQEKDEEIIELVQDKKNQGEDAPLKGESAKKKKNTSQDFIKLVSESKEKEEDCRPKFQKEKSFIRIPEECTAKKKSKPCRKQEIAVKPRAPPVRLRRPVKVNVHYEQDSDTDTDLSDSDLSSVHSTPEKKALPKNVASTKGNDNKSVQNKSGKSVDVIKFSECQPEVENNPTAVKDNTKPSPLLYTIDVGKGKTESIVVDCSSDSDDSSENTVKDEKPTLSQDVVEVLDESSEDSSGESSSEDSSEGDFDMTSEPDAKLDFNIDGGMDGLLKSTPRNESQDNKWHIEDQDRYNMASTLSRYFCERKIQCRNCREEGHMSRDCPEPLKQRCAFCAGLGHSYQACPQSVCHNCQAPGHRSKDCTQPRQNRYAECGRCWMKGHHHSICPDRWRQYHLTIHRGHVVEAAENTPPNPLVYCYNCGSKGHLGFECNEERMNRFVPANYPFVAEYDKTHSKLSPKKDTRKGETVDDKGGKKRKRVNEKSKKHENESVSQRKKRKALHKEGSQHKEMPAQELANFDPYGSQREPPTFDPYGSRGLQSVFPRPDQESRERSRPQFRHHDRRTPHPNSWPDRHSLSSSRSSVSSHSFQNSNRNDDVSFRPPYSSGRSDRDFNQRHGQSHGQSRQRSRHNHRGGHRPGFDARDTLQQSDFSSEDRTRFMMAEPHGDMGMFDDLVGARGVRHGGGTDRAPRGHHSRQMGGKRSRSEHACRPWNGGHHGSKKKKKDKSSSKNSHHKEKSKSSVELSHESHATAGHKDKKVLSHHKHHRGKHAATTPSNPPMSKKRKQNYFGFQSTNEIFWESRAKPANGLNHHKKVRR